MKRGFGDVAVIFFIPKYIFWKWQNSAHMKISKITEVKKVIKKKMKDTFIENSKSNFW